MIASLREKKVYEVSEIIYLGTMFFEVHAWSFVQLILFQAPKSIFVS